MKTEATSYRKANRPILCHITIKGPVVPAVIRVDPNFITLLPTASTNRSSLQT